MDLLTYEKNLQTFMINNGAFEGEDGFENPSSVTTCLECLNKVSNVTEFFDTPIFYKNKRINDMMITKLSGKNEANQGPPCPRCGGERYFLRIQRRGSDEMANNELHCSGCGLVQQC